MSLVTQSAGGSDDDDVFRAVADIEGGRSNYTRDLIRDYQQV